MKKTTLALAFSAAALGIGACGSTEALVGTAAGAAVGSAASGGSKVATVAGGVVGYQVGKRYGEKND